VLKEPRLELAHDGIHDAQVLGCREHAPWRQLVAQDRLSALAHPLVCLDLLTVYEVPLSLRGAFLIPKHQINALAWSTEEGLDLRLIHGLDVPRHSELDRLTMHVKDERAISAV
jgi:hypothetical protein